MLNLALKSGTPGATRTPDTRFRKPLLCPPELQGHYSSEALKPQPTIFYPEIILGATNNKM